MTSISGSVAANPPASRKKKDWAVSSFLGKKRSRGSIHYFCSHLISEKLVMWPHLATRKGPDVTPSWAVICPAGTGGLLSLQQRRAGWVLECLRSLCLLTPKLDSLTQHSLLPRCGGLTLITPVSSEGSGLRVSTPWISFPYLP